ncbi:MAG: DNA repair protein RecO [Phycisphaeraceae bacterium]
MPRFKDQAICIRLIDWSETSQVVALLTEHHGKIRAIAKGAKRTSPSSVQRYSGGVELLTLGQAVGVIKQSAELANLTEWDLQQSYWHLRGDLDAQRFALYAADLVNAMLAERDAHPVVFGTLRDLLAALEEPAKRQAALLCFQWRVLEDCGYRPELDRDVIGGGGLGAERSFTFDARAGGLTAATGTGTGAVTAETAWKVRAETVALLRAMANATDDWSAVKSQTLKRANRLLCVYARAILDRQLPTMGYVLGES